jgi:glutamate-ammonia-ligase adenylyltransferase
VVRDVEALDRQKPRPVLIAERDKLLAEAAASADDKPAARRAALNAFKDREMFRIDMRHIIGRITEFGQFSEELSDLADVVVDGAHRVCEDELRARYGTPRLADGGECRLAICALGKCGGRELGFASDIELMFVYEGNGTTDGPKPITTTEYFLKLVENFRHSITARQEGIFQVDLRLRPYGRAGSLAVSADTFAGYFGPDGAAWPYERQALVKLRPVAGDDAFGADVARLRDRLIYTGDVFDLAAMRAMREKQVLQLVRAGTVNVKLSPGGLVDCEYLVQGLQLIYGADQPAVRTTNTLEALAALRDAGLISAIDHNELADAYIFLRRLIDALRVVRGNAKDLSVPPADSEEFVFLSRRLGYGSDPSRLRDNLNRATECVREMTHLLDHATRADSAG